MKKIQGYDNKWYEVSKYESCCDCGLCHQKEFKVVFKKGVARVYFRAWRDEKRTEENRKIIKE